MGCPTSRGFSTANPADSGRMTGKPEVIRPERRDVHSPHENLLIKWRSHAGWGFNLSTMRLRSTGNILGHQEVGFLMTIKIVYGRYCRMVEPGKGQRLSVEICRGIAHQPRYLQEELLWPLPGLGAHLWHGKLRPFHRHRSSPVSSSVPFARQQAAVRPRLGDSWRTLLPS